MNRKAQDKALKVALNAAKGAGLIALKHYKRLKNISLKEGAGLVSEADLQAEKFIMKTIRKSFPDDQFLGEEGGLSKFEGHDCALWLVDPLDGTTNYVHGFPFFCVSIGLEVKGESQVAVVHAPLLKYTFTAIQGRGSFLNGKKIKVSKTEAVEDSLLATGFSYKKSDILELELRDFKNLANAARGSQTRRKCSVRYVHGRLGRVRRFLGARTFSMGYSCWNFDYSRSRWSRNGF